MKKIISQILIFIIFSIFVILVSGCGQNIEFIDIENTQDFNKDIENTQDFNPKYTNLFECEQIQEDDPEKEICYLTVALVKEDPKICEKLIYSAYGYKLDIVDSCKLDVVVAKGDSKACENFESQYLKDSCHWSFGVKEQDLEICEKIQDEYDKDNCYSFVLQ